MNLTTKIGRSLATSAVALFLVAGAVLGANAVGAAPSASPDAIVGWAFNFLSAYAGVPRVIGS
ncbi:MAG: hypothetical protein ABIZ72_01555, partial [Candidatus Limnocylindrales bacterium]